MCLLKFRDESPADDENPMDMSKPLESDRQNDAMTVQRAFAAVKKVVTFGILCSCFGDLRYIYISFLKTVICLFRKRKFLNSTLGIHVLQIKFRVILLRDPRIIACYS